MSDLIWLDLMTIKNGDLLFLSYSLMSFSSWWFKVFAAESKALENAIRCGGLAPTKAACIKNLLSCLLEKKGKLCLEYLRELSVDEIKAELSLFKGIGPKTVIFLSPYMFSVLLFRKDSFLSVPL